METTLQAVTTNGENTTLDDEATRAFGAPYQDYLKRVPAFIPIPRRRATEAPGRPARPAK